MAGDAAGDPDGAAGVNPGPSYAPARPGQSDAAVIAEVHAIWEEWRPLLDDDDGPAQFRPRLEQLREGLWRAADRAEKEGLSLVIEALNRGSNEVRELRRRIP